MDVGERDEGWKILVEVERFSDAGAVHACSVGYGAEHDLGGVFHGGENVCGGSDLHDCCRSADSIEPAISFAVAVIVAVVVELLCYSLGALDGWLGPLC